jgi:hypothetical protein
MNEAISLDETVKIICRDVRGKIKEILIIVCKRTTPEAMAVANRLRGSLPELVIVHEQSLPYLGCVCTRPLTWHAAAISADGLRFKLVQNLAADAESLLVYGLGRSVWAFERYRRHFRHQR